MRPEIVGRRQGSGRGTGAGFSPARRAVLRRGACLAAALMLPGVALAAGEGDLLTRFPWMLPWVEGDGFDPAWLRAKLEGLTPDQQVLHLMDHQAEARPYHEYRARVVNGRRIREGRRLIRRHRALLDRVEAEFHAPAEVVVALWGVESDFGSSQGRFSVLRSLFTLAAFYPRRAAYFQSELREFLLLCREEGWEPREPRGSYAGAFGQVQMMPGTFRRYAVDFDRDGRRDVVGDVQDSLGSIAAFLQGHGWCSGAPIAQPLPDQPGLGELLTLHSGSRRPWREWRSGGIVWPAEEAEPDADDSLALIVLEEPHGPRYYMTFMNFWVITRWNRSNRFAMAVRELALELRKPE